MPLQPKTVDQLLKEATTYTVTGYGKIPLEWVREAFESLLLEAKGRYPKPKQSDEDVRTDWSRVNAGYNAALDDVHAVLSTLIEEVKQS